MDPSNPHQSSGVNQSDTSSASDGLSLRLNRPFGVYVVILCNLFGAYVGFEHALSNLETIVSLENPLWYRAFLAANLLTGIVNLVSVYGLWGLKRWGGILALAALLAVIAMGGWLESIKYDLGLRTRTEAIDSFTITILLYSGFVLYVLTPKFQRYFTQSTAGKPHSRESFHTKRTPGLEFCTFVAVILGLVGIAHSWENISESTSYLPFLDVIAAIINYVISMLYFVLAHGLWTLQLWARGLAKIIFLIQIAFGLIALLLASLTAVPEFDRAKASIVGQVIVFGILLAYIRSQKVKRLLT